MSKSSAQHAFTFIDLFAGIGGFHQALHSLGGRCVLASDIDPDCKLVYRRNFPDTKFRGDIAELTTPAGIRKIPPHDVLCAGFPCQPFSKSGAQLGRRDKIRGTLFFHIMEIVRVRRPRFVILENVRNLAGPRHARTWETIVQSLRDYGYRVSDEPLIFSPHLLPKGKGGRPQVRERVYVLAEHIGDVAKEELQAAPLVPNRPVGGWKPSMWSIEDYLEPDHRIRHVEQYRLRSDEWTWLAAWQDFIELFDEELPGFPIWADSLRDAVDLGSHNPEWKNEFHRKNYEFYQANRKKIDKWRERTVVDGFPASRRKFEWQARGHARDLSKLIIHFRPSGIRVRPPTYVPALVAITQTSVIGARGRRLTPFEAARLQGFGRRFVHPNDAVAYRQLGNAVNVGVTRFLARTLFDSSERGWPGALPASRRDPRPTPRPVQLRFLETA